MKSWIYICAIVTLLAAIFSFTGVPVASGIAKVVFVIFLILLIISVAIQYGGRRRTE